MKAAFGRVSITPPINDTFPDLFFDPEGTLDEIYARVAILEADSSPIVLVALDVLGIGLAEIADLETDISNAVIIDAEKIWILSSHSHSAPILCPIDLYDGFSPYFAGLKDRIICLITNLMSQLQPVTIHFGQSNCDFNVNRRLVDTNGNCRMAPNIDGVVDKSVPVISCRDINNSLVGILFSYCCHPTILLGPKISGDYPGWAQNSLEKKHEPVVALFLPGVFGNVRPYFGSGDRFRPGTESDVISCGYELANAVEEGLKNSYHMPTEVIQAWRIKPQLPLDKPLSMEELGKIASQSIASQSENDSTNSWKNGFNIARRQWVQKVRLEKIEDRVPTHQTYTFSRIRLGELNLVGFSGEFFLEYGIYAQFQRSPEKTLAFGYTQGCQTYVPTTKALAEGGYEVHAYKRWKQSCPFKPEVEGVVKDAISDLMSFD